MGISTAVLILAAIVALTIVYVAWLSKQDSYFPGPAPRFLAGNIHQIPRLESWKVFARWSKDYGPAFLLRAFGQNIIVLNSHDTVMDMLELRSSNYSGRPVLWIYKQVLGQDLDVFTAPSSHPRFQAYRKLLHTALNPKAVRSYRSLQECEVQILLRSLHYQPEAFVNHLRRNAGAVILEIAYGWTVNHDGDYLVNLMEESFKINAEINGLSSWLVAVLPILRFIPSWVLGCTSFERMAQKYKKQLERCFHVPHEWAKEQIQSGMYIESFTSRSIQREHILDTELEDLIKMCSTALYAGGADTTVAAMTTFFLTMTLNLDVQRIAQEEIDRVIGHERLPTTQDQSKLPYVEALIKEVLRWAPVGPLGLPHSALKCDSYQGYTIPAGSTVIANIWALMHDPAVYPDPFKFKPARFLSDGAFEAQYDPRHYVFGFGRRVCPGAHLANASLFLNIASVLAAFSILKPLDDDGKEFDSPVEYTSGVIMHPKPFPCRIIARAHAIQLLQLED